VQVRIFKLLDAGDQESVAEAKQLHRSILPMIQFASHSPAPAPAHMLAYGKQMFAWRADIKSIHPRAPPILRNTYNLDVAKVFVQDLPTLE
jgi:dihydrodipicolinate synthase/N-acetylneuraminate lyase